MKSSITSITIKFLTFFLFVVMLILVTTNMSAQCGMGEIAVSMEVHTDNWGYECYWEITPAGNDCGEGTIASGGNTIQMNCNSGGDQNATNAQGYEDNAAIIEGEWCLEIGTTYALHFIDDYGDGGTVFHILIGGLEMFAFTGEGANASWNFTVNEPLTYNAWIFRPIMYRYLYSNEAKVVSAELVNFGSSNISVLEANYSFNGGPQVTEIFTGFDLNPNDRHIITFSEPWMETVLGEYELEITITAVNGLPDQDMNDNTLNETVIIGDPIPDLVYSNVSGTMYPTVSVIGDESEEVDKPTDLDFHPTLSNYELWIINRGTENTGGSTVIFRNAGMDTQTEEHETDGNSWHFMSLPSGMAFGRNENWASSPSVQDANHSGGYYTGPTLWSSDPDIYAEDSGGNGSHLDMIHQSPNSMGICNAGDNRFYLYDGYNNRVFWYDFVKDHGPGNDDHSDGRVRKFIEPVLNNQNTTIPNHMVLDENTGWLYVCDNGDSNPRVFRLNTNTEMEVGEFAPFAEEPLAETTTYSAEWEEYITDGLIRPCGIDMNGTKLLVSDYATGYIHIYETSGDVPVLLGQIDTGSDGVAGIKVGPDGKVWYVNYLDNTLMRIEDTVVGINENVSEQRVVVFPNPSNNEVWITCTTGNGHQTSLCILNSLGQIVTEQSVTTLSTRIDTSAFESGVYIVLMQQDGNTIDRTQLVIQH